MRAIRLLVIAALVAAAAATSSSAAVLNIGDDAPAIHVATWVNGGPISLADGKGKTVYVVEFWATWCGPCRASIPHLSQLYTRLKAKGVEIVGISREDVPTIRKFAQDMNFTYNVGADDGDKTSAAWMEGVRGIPHAFIVDKSGKIAWTGHPMNGLDTALEAILAGTYDAESAAKVAGIKQRLQSQLQGRDIDGGILSAKEILQIDPNDTGAFDVLKQIFEYKKDPAAFKDLCRALLGRDINASALNNIAWSLLTAETMAFREVDLAHEAAEKAVAKDRDPSVVDTLARVYFELGLVDRAIGLQKEVVRTAKGDLQEQAQATLNYYESVKRAADRLRFR